MTKDERIAELEEENAYLRRMVLSLLEDLKTITAMLGGRK